jgi:sporulation protein YlmC with PRC-barrel domain
VNQNQHLAKPVLEKLRDSGLALANPEEDIRGRKIVDQHGGDIGHVSALFIDEAKRKVRMLEIRAGGFLGLGDRHFLLPADAITKVTADKVQVNETLQRIVNSPVYDPALIVAPPHEYWEPFYGYYGLSPYAEVGIPIATQPEALMPPHSSHASEESREQEQEDLEQGRRDAGQNYGGFGKVLDDSPAAEIDQALREHHETAL